MARFLVVGGSIRKTEGENARTYCNLSIIRNKNTRTDTIGREVAAIDCRDEKDARRVLDCIAQQGYAVCDLDLDVITFGQQSRAVIISATPMPGMVFHFTSSGLDFSEPHAAKKL